MNWELRSGLNRTKRIKFRHDWPWALKSLYVAAQARNKMKVVRPNTIN